MKKFALLFALLPILTACNLKNISQTSSQPSDFAKRLTEDVLEFPVNMMQGDSQKPLSPAFKACMIQPHPQITAIIQRMVEKEFSKDEIALLGETFDHIENKTTPTDPAMLAKVNQAKTLIQSKQASLQKIALTVMKMGGDEKIGNEIHAYTNARIKACQSHL